MNSLKEPYFKTGNLIYCWNTVDIIIMKKKSYKIFGHQNFLKMIYDKQGHDSWKLYAP